MESQQAPRGDRRQLTTSLPREVISLIQHVQLNRHGWWDKAVDQFILAAYWSAGIPMTIEQCQRQLRQELDIDLDSRLLKRRADSLVHKGKLIMVDGHRYGLSLSAREELESELKEAMEREDKVTQLYCEILEEYDPRLLAAVPWECFERDFLVRYVADLGAQIYELLLGAKLSAAVTASDLFQEMLDKLSPDLRRPFTDAVIRFLDPRDPNVRWHVLRLLSAYFCLEACRLSAADVAKITRMATPTFKFFLDTNCLFSLLGLHDNPSNEAVEALSAVISQLPKHVDVKLYLLPETVEEAKRVLVNHRDFFANTRVTGNMLEALQRMEAAGEVEITGLMEGYLRRAVETGQGALPPAEHFGFYVKNILAIAREKGVEVFQTDLSAYHTRQDVVDDIMEQLEREKEKRGRRAKEYEALRHDMVLWHFTADKRPMTCESPLDAHYWVVTADFRLLGFDRFKVRRNTKDCGVPICLHPSTVVQLLQFWIPRTPELERAIVATLRLPVLFPTFDPDAEQAVLRMVRALGHFENVEKLSPDALIKILVNEELRDRIQGTEDINQEIEVVRDTLLKEHEAREAEVLRQLEEKRAELETEREVRASLERQVQTLTARVENEEQQRKELEAKLEAMERKERQKAGRRRFFWQWCVLGLPLALGGAFSVALVLVRFVQVSVPAAVHWMTPFVIAACAWVMLAARAGRSREALRDWTLYACIAKVDRRLRSWIAALLLPLAGSVLADVIRYLFGI